MGFKATFAGDLPDPVKEWQRYPNESVEAYDAFYAYLMLGNGRSYLKTAEKVEKSLQQVTRWGRLYRWTRRAYLWDVEQDEIRFHAHRDELQKMARRHADVAAFMNQKIIQRLKTMDIDEMKPAELVAWFRTLVQVERQARGAQTLMRQHRRQPPAEEFEGD